MSIEYNIPKLPLDFDFETKAIMRQVTKSNRGSVEI